MIAAAVSSLKVTSSTRSCRASTDRAAADSLVARPSLRSLVDDLHERRATARLGRPMSNQYRVEQDRDVVLVGNPDHPEMIGVVGYAPERTRVELEHRNLDRHGPGWESERDGVAADQGWSLYLDRFAERVAA